MTSPPDDTQPGGEALPGSLPRTTDIGARHIVCPHCETANRLTRSTCVHCERDLSMLRTILNKSRHHFNTALEHAERRRWDEAITELRNCIDLDANFVSAWNVLGTCLAKIEKFDEAREAWQHAIDIDPRFSKAHDYLERVENIGEAKRYYRRLRLVTSLLLVALVCALGLVWMQWRPDPALEHLAQANTLHSEGNRGEALTELDIAIEDEVDPEVFQAAQALRNAIDAEFDHALLNIENARERSDWLEGLAACDRLLAMQPQQSLARLANARQGEFAGRLAERAAGLTNDVVAGNRDASEALASLTDLHDLMPTAVMRTEIAAHIASVEQVYVAQRTEEFNALAADVLSTVPVGDTAASLHMMLALWPEWSDVTEAETIIAALSSQEAVNVESEWAGLVADEDPDAMTAWMNNLKSLQASAEISATASANLAPLSVAIASAEGVIPSLTLNRLLAEAAELDDYQEVTGLIGLIDVWHDYDIWMESLVSALTDLDATASAEFVSLSELGSSEEMASLAQRLEYIPTAHLLRSFPSEEELVVMSTVPEPMLTGRYLTPAPLVAPLSQIQASAEELSVTFRFEEQFALASSQVANEEWEDALGTLQALEPNTYLALTDDQRLTLTDLRETAESGHVAAQERAALALFQQWLDRDMAFETLSISDEEAQEVIEKWEWVVETVPDRIYGQNFRLDYCLFYAARAHELRENASDALALYRRILDDLTGGDHRRAAENHLNRLESTL